MKLLREYIRGLLIETAIGQCYPHAVKMAKDSSQEEFSDLARFKVVHGRVTDKYSGESVLHAWVEKGDMVFDWQTHSTKPDGIPKDIYYDMYSPEIHNEYTAEETMINCLKSGQAGPWTMQEPVLLESNKAAEIRDYYGIDLWMKGPYGGDQYEPDIVEIESLVVPEEKRGQGIATDVMFELVRWADSNGYILALDPSSDFGSSVSRLRKFYSQFGFSGNKGRKKDYRTRYAMIRYPKNKVLKEEARQPSFKHKGSSNYFRVELPGIGYAEGGENMRFPECQSDVDALMKTPEYLAAEEKYVANEKPRTDIVKNEETGEYEEVEVGPAIFRPRFYDVNNAWIKNPENRGKGYGKEIYRAFIDQAVEYSKNYGGVFIGAHHCTIGSGTSSDAKRVWASLAREYNSSGDVIFIGL